MHADFQAVDETDERLDFDNAEQIRYGLDQLSRIHREVLTLFVLQDLPIEEIAGVLETPLKRSNRDCTAPNER